VSVPTGEDRRVTETTHSWTPTYALWRRGFRRAFRRSPLFWFSLVGGLFFLYTAFAWTVDDGPAYLPFFLIGALWLSLPEIAVRGFLRDRYRLNTYLLSWTDESFTVETVVGKTEFKWSIIGWVHADDRMVILTTSVRFKPSLVAVVPDCAFANDAQRIDFVTRASKAAAAAK
jgi:hypothetical protein